MRPRARPERANILLSIDRAIADNNVMDNETNPNRSWWKWATTPPQSYMVYLSALVLVFVLSFYAGALKPKGSTGLGPPPVPMAPRN
jgi:hypothetical protein